MIGKLHCFTILLLLLTNNSQSAPIAEPEPVVPVVPVVVAGVAALAVGKVVDLVFQTDWGQRAENYMIDTLNKMPQAFTEVGEKIGDLINQSNKETKAWIDETNKKTKDWAQGVARDVNKWADQTADDIRNAFKKIFG